MNTVTNLSGIDRSISATLPVDTSMFSLNVQDFLMSHKGSITKSIYFCLSHHFHECEVIQRMDLFHYEDLRVFSYLYSVSLISRIN